MERPVCKQEYPNGTSGFTAALLAQPSNYDDEAELQEIMSYLTSSPPRAMEQPGRSQECQYRASEFAATPSLPSTMDHQQEHRNGSSALAVVAAEQSEDETAVETYLSSFPSGYRFQPTDYELIVDYLLPKINGQPLRANMMHVVNIYTYSPEKLAADYKAQGDKMWYFFTSRDKKYPNGGRPSRKAGDGYWKATGADKPIKYKGKLIAKKRALVFYCGNPPKGTKTSWIMHEFRIENGANSSPSLQPKKKKLTSNGQPDMRLDDCVLCRIYNKEEKEGTGNRRFTLKEEAEEDTELEETPDATVIDSPLPPNNTLANVTNGNRHPMANYSHIHQMNAVPTANSYPVFHRNGPTFHSDMTGPYPANSYPDKPLMEYTCHGQQTYYQPDYCNVPQVDNMNRNDISRALGTENAWTSQMMGTGFSNMQNTWRSMYTGPSALEDIWASRNPESSAFHPQHQDVTQRFNEDNRNLSTMEPSPRPHQGLL